MPRLAETPPGAATPPVAPAAPPAVPVTDPPRPALSLEEIVVEGPAPLGSGVGSVTRFGPAELAARESRTAAEALARATGVRVDAAPTATWANGKRERFASIRGFDPTDVRILLDGVPVEDPYQGTVDLDRLALDAIEALTVARGPTSVLYGPNALGGVVNLVTRLPDRAEGLARCEFDDNRARRLALRLGVPLGPVALLATLSHRETTGTRVPAGFEPQRNENGGLRENSDGRDIAALLKATWRFGRDQRLQFMTDVETHAGGVPFSVSALEPQTLWRRDWRRIQSELALSLRFSDWLAARGKLFVNRFDNRIVTYRSVDMDEVALAGRAISTHGHTALGAFVSPEVSFGRHGRLALAAGWHIDWLAVEPDQAPDTPTLHYRSEQFHLALEGSARPWRWLQLTVGTAYVGLFKEAAAGAETGADLQDYELLAGARATPWPGGEVHAGVARKVGFPRLRQLYGSFGDPNLRPQQAWSTEVGLAHRLTHGPLSAHFAATWFRADLADAIVRHDTGNEVRYRNVARALLTGLEAEADLEPLPWLGLRLAYTLLWTRDRRPERVVPTLDFRPAHTLDAATRLRAPWGLTADLGLRWLSARAYERPGVGGAERARLPGYAQLDLRLSQRIGLAPSWLGAGSLRAFAVLRNVLDALAAATQQFDVYYEESPEQPGAGWSFTFGLEFET